MSIKLIGAALVAAGNVLMGATEAEPDPNTGSGGESTETKRRGRSPGPGKGATGPSDEERLTANKALIDPLIKGNQGAAVKAIIAKHTNGGLLKDLPADKQKEFEADIAALSVEY